MDKETLSNYGWIVICILVLSVMIALATPFGGYIATAVENTTEALFKTQQSALSAADIEIMGQEFEDMFSDGGSSGTETPAPVVGSATFTDGVTLTWEELKLAENGTKYGYDASAITDTSIDSVAFSYCTSLTSIDLPDSLKTIGGNAFNGCTSLTSIDLPDSLKTIGDNAFYGCTSLTSIDLPDSLTTIGTGTFKGCTSLTSIDLPDSLTTIGNGAFNGCTSLANIDLPDSLTTIDGYAFYGCTSLTSIDLPDSLTSIYFHAFSSCTSLTSINYAGSMDDWGDITLGDYWNKNVPATVVQCSDGEVTL